MTIRQADAFSESAPPLTRRTILLGTPIVLFWGEFAIYWRGVFAEWGSE